VKDAQGGPAYGRTNWRKFAVAVGVPTVVAGGLIAATATGALAASFTISSTDFKLSADHLHGDGFTQYSGGLPTASGAKIAAMSGIKHATLTKMCQTVKGPNPFGGSIVMRIDAGAPDANGTKHDVVAENLLIGMSDLQGDATFKGIQIGLDASKLDADGSTDPHGAPGSFGQQATTVDIEGLRQTAYYTSAGTFTLNGMRLHLFTGDEALKQECF
jgi:hypothetical protein